MNLPKRRNGKLNHTLKNFQVLLEHINLLCKLQSASLIDCCSHSLPHRRDSLKLIQRGKSRGLSTTGVCNAITSTIAWNHLRITLKAYIPLCSEVAPSGGKPIENSCVAFCSVLFWVVCFFFCYYLWIRSLSDLQIATIL